jgi:hypothetical protein
MRERSLPAFTQKRIFGKFNAKDDGCEKGSQVVAGRNAARNLASKGGAVPVSKNAPSSRDTKYGHCPQSRIENRSLPIVINPHRRINFIPTRAEILKRAKFLG